MDKTILRRVTTFALALALLVVMLGAYTRLTDAGLGCPDWPGCYGHMVLPSDHQTLQKVYPNLPVEPRKAWTEMIHRYAAGTLGLLIFFMAGCVCWLRHKGENLSYTSPLVLVALVFFQAALGMWTVTLKLLPVVVMGHLLGGIVIFSLLSRFRLALSSVPQANLPRWSFWIGLGVLIVFLQIALGGWVSSNYAGIACIGFPQCNGKWVPSLHILQAFNVFSPIGQNYQGGLLDNDLRLTIQWFHRLGAMITFLYVLFLSSLCLLRCKDRSLRWFAWMVMGLVISQFSLGVLNVVYFLPLWVAVAHNGVAALLLATMLMMHYSSQGRRHVCCSRTE